MSTVHTNANNPTGIARDETPRARRHRLRNTAGIVLGGEHRTSYCGRRRCAEVVTVNAKPNGRATYRGVFTCGSIWTCPECASKIASGRGKEVAGLVRAHEKAGFACYMNTLTIRHSLGDQCGELRKTLSWAWDQVLRSGAMRRIRDRYNIIGYVRSLEITHGANGWHPHLHVLWFARDLSEADEAHVSGAMFDRWVHVMARRGYEITEKGFDFKRAYNAETAAEYVAKWGTGAEIAKGAQKGGRKGGRSPWQLLDDADHGCNRSAALYLEYAKAFKGARHLTYSRGLRDLYQLEPEADDEQLALMDDGDAPEFEKGGELYRFDKSTWKDVIKSRLTAAVLAAAEKNGCEGVDGLLMDHGIPPSVERPPTAFTGRVRVMKATRGVKPFDYHEVGKHLRAVAAIYREGKGA